MKKDKKCTGWNDTTPQVDKKKLSAKTEYNACGCSSKARKSVRLTDAEIAEDVIASMGALCGAYADCIDDGCNCEDALCSCERVRKSLCEYAERQK